MAFLEPRRNSRAYREAQEVAGAAWADWDLRHPAQARSAPLVSPPTTNCKCGHSAMDHDDSGCRSFDDFGGDALRPCLCERYSRAPHY